MATLERIRQRSGLLIIVIGLAMLAFILTDLLGSGNSLLRGEQLVVGKVNGKSINVNEFRLKMDERIKAIQAQNPQQARFITNKQTADAVWDEVLQEEIMGKQYQKLGFTVTSDELLERIKQNQSIRTAPAFRDPNTGQFSEGMFNQYYSNLEDNKDIDPQAAEFWEQWVTFEQATKKDARTLKYNMAVEKGLYVPTAQAKVEHKRNATQANVQFLVMEYSTISDSTITVTDADLKEYFNEHKEDYKAKETRSIEFVSFKIEPSQADRDALTGELNDMLKPQVVFNQEENVNDTLPSFSTTTEDSTYALSKSDLPVGFVYFKRGALPASIDSTIFDQEEGYVHGPYEESGYYYLSKITEKRTLPDSVRARHILISYAGANNGQSNSERPPQEAQKLADSLFAIVQADTSQFADLAIANSDDPGSGAKGGDLGWFTDQTMVKPFSDFSFQNNTGDIKIVFSQFGFHIIEILDQGGETDAIQLISIAREIAPSEKTRDDIYSEANNFASSVNGADNFSSLAEERGYSPRPVTNIEPFDENLPGVGNNRDIVKWAYGEERKIGDITLENNDDSYVVLILTDTEDEGYQDPLAIRALLEPEVIKNKKAEQLIEKFAGAMGEGKDLLAVAQALSLPVKNQTANMGAANITGYGREPKVIGQMCTLGAGEISQPIKGSRGVYVAQGTGVTPGADLPDYSSEKQKLEQEMRPRVAAQVFASLKEDSKIDDRRPNFY